MNKAGPQGYVAPSREGKICISAYLAPGYKKKLRLLQAETGKHMQDLIAEAFNDLYRKHGMPPVE